MAESSRWHPILAAREGPPGTWSLVDGFYRVYGTIEIRRVNATDLRYRATFQGEVIGWSTSLSVACERVHAEFIRGHGPKGGPIASWGGSDPSRWIEKPLCRFDVFLVEKVERRIVGRSVVCRE